MSIVKSPFTLGGVASESTKVIKRTSGQKIDDVAFSKMVGKSSNLAQSNQENIKIQPDSGVISRLFANGLAMGEAQHQQNEMVMQSILPQNQGVALKSKQTSGITIQTQGKGIPIDVTRDVIFSSHNISMNRKNIAPLEVNSKELSLSIGQLAAQFESGKEGISAIGYDQAGGTSYGKYQIASKPGSMDQFILFLEKESPAIATRLKNAGPANTGSRDGKMPQVWREIAQEQPEVFESLQKRFILESHYTPVLNGIKEAGYNVDSLSPAMQEVLWSTAVQHGPSGAVRIFTQSADKAGISEGQAFSEKEEQQLIQNIYDVRETSFGSSTVEIQAAVQRRMQSEKTIALAMLQSKGMTA